MHRELCDGILSNFKALGLSVPHSEVGGCESLALAIATVLGLVLGRTEFRKGKMAPPQSTTFLSSPSQRNPTKI